MEVFLGSRIRRIVGRPRFWEPKGSEWLQGSCIGEALLKERWDPRDPPPDPRSCIGKAGPPGLLYVILSILYIKTGNLDPTPRDPPLAEGHNRSGDTHPDPL